MLRGQPVVPVPRAPSRFKPTRRTLHDQDSLEVFYRIVGCTTIDSMFTA
jgi:hypothetical protein